MKIHFSISLKLTIIVVAVSAAVILLLTMYNINEQAISFENIYVDKARDISRLMDISFSSEQNDSQIISMIRRINESDEIKEIDIYIRDQNQTLNIYSTDPSMISEPANYYINFSIESNNQVKFRDSSPASHDLTIITPFNSSNNIRGAYVLLFSIERSIKAFESKTTNLILISIASLFILIFSFLFLLRKTIVRPIMTFRDTARIFGKGELNKRISIRSNDEIGELADAFNTMAKDLQTSRTKIEEYNKILEQLLDQKDEFIGQLGHDLKNPLQSIVGLLPILAENEQNPKMKQHLEVLNTDAQYMRELIFKTLELAKLRSQNIEFDFSNLNLQSIVEETIKSDSLLYEKHHIQIIDMILKDVSVYADKLRLQEVIKNLLTNAVKYTPGPGGSITISSEEHDDMVTVSIKDEGSGLTAEQIKKIFDKFYRAHSTNVEKGSIGLGLSIAKRIIEIHGGRIWAESEGPGKGSTFKFELKKGKL
jgi:two-component system, sensor histidine kinase ChiS